MRCNLLPTHLQHFVLVFMPFGPPPPTHFACHRHLLPWVSGDGGRDNEGAPPALGAGQAKQPCGGWGGAPRPAAECGQEAWCEAAV